MKGKELEPKLKRKNTVFEISVMGHEGAEYFILIQKNTTEQQFADDFKQALNKSCENLNVVLEQTSLIGKTDIISSAVDILVLYFGYRLFTPHRITFFEKCIIENLDDVEDLGDFLSKKSAKKVIKINKEILSKI